jgi:hypothetical protein
MKFPLSIIAGVVQAAGSVLAKVTSVPTLTRHGVHKALDMFLQLAFSSDSMVVTACHNACLAYDHDSEHKQEICSGVCILLGSAGCLRLVQVQELQVALLVRGVILLILIVLNSGGLVLSVRGMSQVGSFLGTVLTTASNLMATVRTSHNVSRKACICCHSQCCRPFLAQLFLAKC